MPGLKIYKHIYNDNHELDNMLQNQIVSTYHSFIEFCIAATKYYKSNRLRKRLKNNILEVERLEMLTNRILGRWLKAFGPANSIVDKTNKLQDEIVKMRELCEDLLNKNVDELKKSNKGEVDPTEVNTY